jgi:hypothetical protein
MRAAQQGYPPAETNLGIMYSNGCAVPPDEAQAIRWLRKAAKRHFAPAEFVLGSIYQTRQGTDKNLAEAVRWYRSAAKQGYAPAENNLGVMYDKGAGVPLDVEQAIKWYRRATEQGDGSAAENLAYLYADSRSGKTDLASAYFWALVALRHPAVLSKPLPPAYPASLRSRLSPTEITRIEALVQNWLEAHSSSPGTTYDDWYTPWPAGIERVQFSIARRN